MKFHLMQTGVIGRKHELEHGMAGQRGDLYQRFLEEIRGYVELADELGYAGYCQPEHHLQIEGFEVNNHPGMFSLFVGLHSKRLMAGTMGYTLTTHNPVRVAEEIATLDHMLGGRLFVGFTRGYHARWVDSYAAIRGTSATTPHLAKTRDDKDTINREIFEESVKVIKKAWTSEVFSHEGKHWQFPPDGGSAGHPAYAEFGKGQDEDGIVRQIGIAPLCFQDPHPKIYGAFAHSMRTVDMWAREGGKPIVLASDLDFCETLWNRYGELAEQAGRDVPREDRGAWGGFLDPHRRQGSRRRADGRAPLVLGEVVHPARSAAAELPGRQRRRDVTPDRGRARSARLQRAVPDVRSGSPRAGRERRAAREVRQRDLPAIREQGHAGHLRVTRP